ncbi:MAG: hypothetical protein KJZ75_11400 [Hyphomonadaceae bacterium]|nr:hypothetical protein [Hyphomonadaceae bacterium]
MSKHDTRLIAAFEQVPEGLQKKMREALKRPHQLGAFIGSQEQALTKLGYAVHSGFVTPLGAEMVRAADAPVGGAKPKRKARGA